MWQFRIRSISIALTLLESACGLNMSANLKDSASTKGVTQYMTNCVVTNGYANGYIYVVQDFALQGLATFILFDSDGDLADRENESVSFHSIFETTERLASTSAPNAAFCYFDVSNIVDRPATNIMVNPQSSGYFSNCSVQNHTAYGRFLNRSGSMVKAVKKPLFFDSAFNQISTPDMYDYEFVLNRDTYRFSMNDIPYNAHYCRMVLRE